MKKTDSRLRHILTTALVVGAAIVLLGTTADPDLWGHVRFGQDIVASGVVRHDDTYSFTSSVPWINHEWLAEVVMALSFRIGGAIGLNLLRLAIIGLVLALIWSRLKGAEHLLRLQLLGMAGLGILLRVHPVRPQLFSVLLFAVTLWLITRSERRDSIAPIAIMPMVMVLWVNVHGGWVVGLGTLGYWIAARIVTRRAPSGRPVLLAVLGVTAVLATAVNPYGLEMWRFLVETVRLDRPMISDWQPAQALPLGFAALWLIPAVMTVVAVARAPERIDRAHLGLVVLLGVAALRVSRLDAFFTLTAIFLLGPLLYRTVDTLAATDAPPLRGLLRPLTIGAALVVIVCVGVWRVPKIAMPLSSPEPEAAHYVREHQLEGKMLTWFDWGQYAIWHFSPHIRVSMDGRRETVYAGAVTAEHMKFYAGAPGFVDYPDRIGADYIWLPRDLPVVPKLRASGWLPAFEGPVSVLLTRADHPVTVRSTSLSGRRVFPDM